MQSIDPNLLPSRLIPCWSSLALGVVLLIVSTGRTNERDDAIEALKAKGWQVVTKGPTVTALYSPRAKEKWATAEDLAALKGFPEISELHLFGDGVTDDSLAVLDELKSLRRFELVGCPRVTDAAVNHFTRMTELTSLSLNAGITAEGVKRLPTMEKVVDLGLGGDHFTKAMVSLVSRKFPNAVKLDFNHPNKLKDADLAPLAELKHAEVLVLSGAVGLGDGIGKVAAQMKTLHQLSVNHVQFFSDKGLEELKVLPVLESIQLGNKGVTDAGMVHLAAIRSLKRIVIGDPCHVTAMGVAALVELPRLSSLVLQTPGLTDETMLSLAKMPALENLELVNEDFTDAALAQVKNLQHLKRLRIGDYNRQPKITDAGLKSLAELQGLKELEVISIDRKCKDVTDASIAELRKALPKVKVSH